MIDRQRLAQLMQEELDEFIAARPRSIALHERARGYMPDGVPMAWMVYHYEHPTIFAQEAIGTYLVDVDGHRYLDMNLSDMSMATGYAIPSVADTIDARFRTGSQMLLPTEDSITVARWLSERFGKPGWQFTLSASSANTEVIRIARAFTDRENILMFDGKYHGHIDQALHGLTESGVEPEFRGLPKHTRDTIRIATFNDIDSVEAALRDREVACLITEPAFTTVGGILMPEPGFLADLRDVTSRYGTLLIIDETHTHVSAYGGLTAAWHLESDILVLGKALGGGIPIGAYGLSEELKRFLEQPNGCPPTSRFERVATGGTMFANTLQMAAARATLEHVLTEEAQLHTAQLGGRLADGIEASLGRHGLPWSVWRLFCRSGFHCAPKLPRNMQELAIGDDREVRGYLRICLANRGVWEAVTDAGPAVSMAATEADVDHYLSVLDDCLGTLPH